jgi:hypothetical protein
MVKTSGEGGGGEMGVGGYLPRPRVGIVLKRYTVKHQRLISTFSDSLGGIIFQFQKFKHLLESNGISLPFSLSTGSYGGVLSAVPYNS